MKSLKVGDTILADGYKAKVYSLPNKDGDMLTIIDEGLWSETFYGCSIHDISLDDNGDFVLDTDFTPVVGDTVGINEKDFQLVDIDDDVDRKSVV